MNNDLISREYVENIVEELENICINGDEYILELLSKIKNAPPVTPQSGHWVEEKISAGARKVFCSECGCSPPFEHVNTGDVYSASGYGVINKTKFCPNCGAKMKGGAE